MFIQSGITELEDGGDWWNIEGGRFFQWIEVLAKKHCWAWLVLLVLMTTVKELVD